MSRPNHIVEPEELMAYLDGELPPDQALDTAVHLEHCRECQTLTGELKEVRETLLAWEVEKVEESLPDRITSDLDRERQDKPASTHLGLWPRMPTGREMQWGGALVVILLLIVAVSLPGLLRSRMRLKAGSSLVEYQESHSGLQNESRSNKKQPAMPSATPLPAKTETIAGFGQSGGQGTAGKLKSGKADSNGTISGHGDHAQNSFSVDGQPMTDQQNKVFSNQVPDNAVDLKNPMIIRTADLAVTVKDFGKARSALDEMLKRHQGHVGDLNVNTPAGAARSLTGTLRVPTNRLDAALSDLKSLGRVERESQGGEEVTQQYVDLQARLANSKHTEERLTEILRERTGKLSEVLAVQMQISRVRGEIEQMEAQRKTMKNQVDFATLNLTLTEEYKKELNVAPPSTGMQLRNAAVDGYRSLVDSIIEVLLWLVSTAPTLLLWIAILFFPARMVWRKLKPRLAKV